MCKRCVVFAKSVMERHHLEPLSVKDLKYYTRTRSISSPINANKQQLIDLILASQAKQLSDMARKALAQVQGGATGTDFETVDLDKLQPYTSAYSSQSSQTGVGTSVDSEADNSRSGLTGLSAATGGSRVREEDDAGHYSSKRPKKVILFST